MWGELTLAWQILCRWGLSGLRTVMRSERVFSSSHLAYGIVVRTK